MLTEVTRVAVAKTRKEPMPDPKNTLYCSFCGKSQHEVKKLIAGPTVFICDECTELCMDIIATETATDPRKELRFKTLSDMTMPIALDEILVNKEPLSAMTLLEHIGEIGDMSAAQFVKKLEGAVMEIGHDQFIDSLGKQIEDMKRKIGITTEALAAYEAGERLSGEIKVLKLGTAIKEFQDLPATIRQQALDTLGAKQVELDSLGLDLKWADACADLRRTLTVREKRLSDLRHVLQQLKDSAPREKQQAE